MTSPTFDFIKKERIWFISGQGKGKGMRGDMCICVHMGVVMVVVGVNTKWLKIYRKQTNYKTFYNN